MSKLARVYYEGNVLVKRFAPGYVTEHLVFVDVRFRNGNRGGRVLPTPRYDYKGVSWKRY